jgi:two-component system response regulator HydG
MKANILIVEDQFIEANNLRIILKKAGYTVLPIARSVSEALEVIGKEKPDLVLLDIHLDGNLTGIDLAKTLRKRNIAFVFLSANSNKHILDAAKETRPYGFLVKPFRQKDVLVMLDVAWYLHQQNQESVIKKSTQQNPLGDVIPADAFEGIIGESYLIKDVLKNIRIVSPSDMSVLILGESGTGKEQLAKSIHLISTRSTKPLIVVNCAALPASLIEAELFGHEKGSFTGAFDKKVGKFERADGGTIFLDEIGELPLDLQVKFLRVLQEKEIEPIGGKKRNVDVRVVAATNRNLEEEVSNGRFRMDLYYRLNVFPVTVPPLRTRKGDIPLLANHFLKVYAHKENRIITGFSDEVRNAMLDYSWPGNIRELENLIARAVLLSDTSVVNFLDFSSGQKAKLPPAVAEGRIKSMTENERDHIVAALHKCEWKIYGPGGAAEILEMNGSTLSSRMKKLGINKKSHL